MTTTENRLSTEAGLRDLPAFPAGFRWGLATAAYQIEGAATEGGRGPSIWDSFAHTPGLSHHGDTGDIACDHYHRWEADLDLLAHLGATDYRLSVSWSRLQPRGEGDLNPEAVAFYRGVLEGLRERGIRPLVTLYHWDLPQPLEDAGGWPERATAERFADYADRTARALGDLATDWVTLNEPWCSSFLGYGSGAHAPGRTEPAAAVAAAHHLNLAHGLAVPLLRAAVPGARVGITNIVTDVVPASESPADRAAATRVDAGSNRIFLDPVYLGGYSDEVHAAFPTLRDHVRDGDLAIIAAPLDYAGINHYQRVLVHHADGAGMLDAAAEAIRDGVALEGYYAWSFLDNFEWAEGYSKRFGLVYVDYGTQERIPKLSAHWYRRTIGEHRAQATAHERSA